MNTQEKVIQLRKQVEKTLTPLINNDYLLFDLPYHSNLGDTLIWQGELDFMKIIPPIESFISFYYRHFYSRYIRILGKKNFDYIDTF